MDFMNGKYWDDPAPKRLALRDEALARLNIRGQRGGEKFEATVRLSDYLPPCTLRPCRLHRAFPAPNNAIWSIRSSA